MLLLPPFKPFRLFLPTDLQINALFIYCYCMYVYVCVLLNVILEYLILTICMFSWFTVWYWTTSCCALPWEGPHLLVPPLFSFP